MGVKLTERTRVKGVRGNFAEEDILD